MTGEDAGKLAVDVLVGLAGPAGPALAAILETIDATKIGEALAAVFRERIAEVGDLDARLVD